MTEEERLAAEAAAAAAKAADDAAAEEAAAKAAEEEAARKAASSADADAALATAKAELEDLKAKLAGFEGIDPAVAKANAEKVAAAEAAAKEAAAAAKKAEKEKAQAENDVAKLREIQNAEHEAAVAAIAAERDAAREREQSVASELTRLRLENAFANSKFIADETILSPAKAQRLFGDYVEVEDGKVVVYDAPKGDAKRAKVMDNKGNALPFNDAITKVINADSDKDTLLKAKTKPGAGTKTIEGKDTGGELTRHQKLLAGLEARRAKDGR